MDTVWILLLGKPRAKIDNNLSDFLFVGVYSSFSILQWSHSQQLRPLNPITWVQHNNRFEGEYYIAKHEIMLISKPVQLMSIAVPSHVDYQITEQPNE